MFCERMQSFMWNVKIWLEDMFCERALMFCERMQFLGGAQTFCEKMQMFRLN